MMQRSRQAETHGRERARGKPEIANTKPKGWRDQAESLSHEVQVIWLICKDPRTPWYAKVVAACAVGYLFSPIQLIPSFLPLIGFADDFLVLAVGFRLTRWLVPATVIDDARARAVARQDEPSLMRAGRIGAVLVAGIWLTITVAATLWLYRM